MDFYFSVIRCLFAGSDVFVIRCRDDLPEWNVRINASLCANKFEARFNFPVARNRNCMVYSRFTPAVTNITPLRG